jgi:hypothetical protein
MSPRFRPPGRTFKERWPHEVEETRYLAATSYAVVLGGLLGVLTAPLGLWHALAAVPLGAGIIVAVLVMIPVAMTRAPAGTHRWLALAWKIGAWVIGACLIGLVVDTITLAMCDEACRATVAPASRPSGLLLSYLLLVAGSIGLALVVDRAGNEIRRRARRAAAAG